MVPSLGHWLADAPPRRNLLRDEEGMLSLASLFVLLGILILFSLLANVGKTVTQKLETQNGADSVAYSSTVEMSRGMNTITGTNHLIGELFALIVLHRALGGDEMEGISPVQPTPGDIRDSVDLSYSLAARWSIGGPTPFPWQWQAVRQEVHTGAALRDSRLQLKRVMTWSYIVHAVGGVLYQFGNLPYLGAVKIIGLIIMYAAMVFESKVYQEWLALEALEFSARVLLPLEKTLYKFLVPGLHLANKAVFLSTPVKAENLAEDLGKHNAVEGSLFPGLRRNTSFPLLQLPVVEEPVTLQKPPRSQLIRASTPWIQLWRVPLLRFGENALLLSRFKAHYLARTDEYTLKLADRLKKDKGVNLYVLKGLDLDGDDKGQEPWTRADGSRQADHLFGIIGFAHRPKPRIASYGIFRQSNPDGLAAYAQGMIYNANPQPQARPATGWQPVVGWDTLNWDAPVPEYPGFTPARPNPPIIRVDEPRIRINWQAKLVPTTRLAESRRWQQGELGRIIKRTPGQFIPLAGTH